MSRTWEADWQLVPNSPLSFPSQGVKPKRNCAVQMVVPSSSAVPGSPCQNNQVRMTVAFASDVLVGRCLFAKRRWERGPLCVLEPINQDSPRAFAARNCGAMGPSVHHCHYLSESTPDSWLAHQQPAGLGTRIARIGWSQGAMRATPCLHLMNNSARCSSSAGLQTGKAD